jgi:hypothetical protein
MSPSVFGMGIGYMTTGVWDKGAGRLSYCGMETGWGALLKTVATLDTGIAAATGCGLTRRAAIFGKSVF